MLTPYFSPAVLLVWMLLYSVPGSAQTPVFAKPSLVESRIATAQAKVKEKPGFAAYNDLASALLRKGRDTNDIAVYQAAEQAVLQSLQLSKDNYEARKLQVAVLLGEHDLAPALKLATELNHKVPDDLAGWAALVDIQSALGNYEDAEKDAQWVLDLRPGNTLGFIKSAQLREVFGDVAGAVEFWDQAIRRTSANDLDEHAWLLTQKARLQLVSGYDKEAEETLRQAFLLFPGSLFATEVLARVRVAQGRSREAADLFEQRYRAVKSASNLYDWAQALEVSGQMAKASAAFQQFEVQARAESGKPFNANLQLIAFHLEKKHDPAAALALAEQRSAQLHDYATLEAYAWALYSNGNYSEAKTQMDRALSVGIRDPLYFCHAAQIAAKAGDATAAQNDRKEIATFKGAACPGDGADSLSNLTRVATQ